MASGRPTGLSAWLLTLYISVATQLSPAAVASRITGLVTGSRARSPFE